MFWSLLIENHYVLSTITAPALVPRVIVELPTRGFSDQIFEKSNMLKVQAYDSI
jgi:hypothetical protein